MHVNGRSITITHSQQLNIAYITYRVGQKSDTSRTMYYIVREVSLFWTTLYVTRNNNSRI